MIAISTLPEAPCFGDSFGLLVWTGAATLGEAGFGAVLTSTRPAPTDDGTGGITMEEADVARFLAADFFTALFFTADFLTAFLAVFFAAVFFTALFFTTDFLAPDFLAVLFLAAVFLTADFFFTAVFLTADFFFTATISPCFGYLKFSLALRPFFLHAVRLPEELFRGGSLHLFLLAPSLHSK